MQEKITTFRDIIAWQKAHQLVIYLYKITENFPKCEEFGLKQHARKSALSIPSNVVEGFKRKTKIESVRFYNIAEGSLEELKYQLLLAHDLEYISDKDYEEFIKRSDEVGKTLSGWLKSQKR